MNSLVSTARTFAGHPTLSKLTSETSAVIYGLLQCPALRSLSIKEDYAMPVAHLVEYRGSAVSLIFKELAGQLVELTVDAPLVWAADKFAELHGGQEEEVSDGTLLEGTFPRVIFARLESLSIGSLHTQSATDFFQNYLQTSLFPSLRTLHISSDEAIIPSSDLVPLTRSCPRLTSLRLASCAVHARSFQEVAEALPKTLESVRISCGDLPMPFLGLNAVGRRNVAKEVLGHVVSALPYVRDVEILHCRFRGSGAGGMWTAHGEANHGSQMDDDDDDERPMYYSRLRRLTLMGFGQLLPDPRFVAQHRNLVSLKLDDISPYSGSSYGRGRESLWDYLATRLPLLQELELKFTRTRVRHTADGQSDWRSVGEEHASVGRTDQDGLSSFASSRSSSSSSLPCDTSTAIFPNLISLAVYAPPSLDYILSIVSAHPNVSYLKLSYLSATSDLTTPTPIALPKLRTLYVHAHGPLSPHYAQHMIQTFVYGAKALVDLKVQATKPMELGSRGGGPAFDIDEAIDAQTIKGMIRSAPRIKSLVLSGVPISVEGWECLAGVGGAGVSLSDSLVHLEASICSSLPLAPAKFMPIQKLLNTHRRLRLFDLCINREPASAESSLCDLSSVSIRNQSSASDNEGDIPHPTTAPAAESSPARTTGEIMSDIRRHDAHYAEICATMSQNVKDTIAPWLDECKIWTPNLRQHRIRALMVRRVQERRRRELAESVGVSENVA
ncbi:hypothetical protein HK104_001558 [Borealophlyctis nickersoniae]|nr:hypothetical protein HK104_001558 [Borealophlyctis nickersoniae]